VTRILNLAMLILAMLLPLSAPAQLFQNSSMSYTVGPAFAKTQAVGNSGVTLYGSAGYAWAWRFERQLKRIGGASLWLDVPLVGLNPSHETATIPGSITLYSEMLVPGVRAMLPLSSRFTFFAGAGGGGGLFSYPAIESSSPPLSTNNVAHGVLSFGAGVDFRLSEHFSLRLDVHDYVTGRNLTGLPGRNDVLPMFGFVMHR
jgi:opacity protein-like surface antigen